MAIISFYAEKIRKLAQLSIEHPEHRRFSIDQRYSTTFLRDDLDPERRQEIVTEAEDGFSFSIREEDLDRTKIPAGIWLVGDQGIYAMFNLDMRAPGLIPEPIEHAVQAFETDPRNVGADGAQHDEKRRIFGGDDAVVFLDAEFVFGCLDRAPAKADRPTVVMFDLGADSVREATPTAYRSWERIMAGEPIPDFFDPDRKAPPRLWASPRADEPAAQTQLPQP